MEETSRFVAVTTTVDSESAAGTLAHAMVEGGLAACVQIASVRSVYRWKGKVEDAPEFLLTAKTQARLAAHLVRLVKSLHTYEVPEIVVMPLAGGSGEYLDWLAAATTGGDVAVSDAAPT